LDATNAINKLEIQLNAARNEIKELKKIITSLQCNNTAANTITYETDEEELARETEWIRVRKNKKRKIEEITATPPLTSQTKHREISL